jgi:hypothetical protein
MRKYLLLIGFLTFAVSATAAARSGTVYRWVDDEGIVHYDDSVPPEYAEQNKDILTNEGVKVGSIRGRKTAEELAAEARAAELAVEEALQLRRDNALINTYLNVEEILMHRDRRVELFSAQSRVTELFLTNLATRLSKLEREASRYLPYSTDPEAPQISPDLIDEMSYTRDTIERHETNLQQFQTDEATIIARFQGDINRFKVLKGIE